MKHRRPHDKQTQGDGVLEKTTPPRAPFSSLSVFFAPRGRASEAAVPLAEPLTGVRVHPRVSASPSSALGCSRTMSSSSGLYGSAGESLARAPEERRWRLPRVYSRSGGLYGGGVSPLNPRVRVSILILL
jgi:hypothetical protein